MKTSALTRPLADRLADGDFTLHEIGEACIRYPAKSANRGHRRRALAEFSSVLGISDAQRLTFTQLTAALASLDRTSALAPETITRIRRDVIGAVRSSRLVPILTAHKEPLNKEWEHVASYFEKQKLPKDAKRLAKWAVIRSIAPAEVNDKVLQTFLRDLSKVFNQLQSSWLAGRISLAWNDIARDKALALQGLSPIVSDRRYRLAKFPGSIEHDIGSYQRSLTSIIFDPIDERGRFKSLNPCSSMQSIKNLRAAVDAYCIAGGSLNNGDNLSVLAILHGRRLRPGGFAPRHGVSFFTRQLQSKQTAPQRRAAGANTSLGQLRLQLIDCDVWRQNRTFPNSFFNLKLLTVAGLIP